MPLTIRPISDALGIEVTGVDFSGPVGADDIKAMEDALHEHLVMVVRDQRLTPVQYLDTLRHFGEIMPQDLNNILMADHPEIAVLDSRQSEQDANGEIFPIGSRDWHTDHTNHARPPKMTALYALALPKSGGGDTGFANMQKAFSNLPPDAQAELLPLKTINTIERTSDYVTDDVRNALASHAHPLVRTHPVTGKKAIYMHPGKTDYIDGMSPKGSHAFIDSLLERALTPDVTYRHKWQVGDLVIWDNRAVLHRAHRDYDHREGRVMHRALLRGEVPV